MGEAGFEPRNPCGMAIFKTAAVPIEPALQNISYSAGYNKKTTTIVRVF